MQYSLPVAGIWLPMATTWIPVTGSTIVALTPAAVTLTRGRRTWAKTLTNEGGALAAEKDLAVQVRLRQRK